MGSSLILWSKSIKCIIKFGDVHIPTVPIRSAPDLAFVPLAKLVGA